MRGEEPTETCMCCVCGGSPPHARGRGHVRHRRGDGGRITPACAGKSARTARGPGPATDHPRMRGEEDVHRPQVVAFLGSPPHARGRAPPGHPCHPGRRITPACAGKRLSPVMVSNRSSDHPRMRGEERHVRVGLPGHRGSPPHARGRGLLAAERAPDGGSPPHARGRARQGLEPLPGGRITPACAGKRASPRGLGSTASDHPRMRGEEVWMDRSWERLWGSPPHARGRASRQSPPSLSRWITPACAGKRLPDLHR